MKYLLVIMLIIVITGCDSSTGLNNKENTITTESSTYKSVENERSNEVWTTYHNNRFGFSISYHVFKGIEYSVSQSLKYQSLKLDSGVKADMWVVYEDGMVLLELPCMSDDEIEYNYYVKVSKDFFDENEKTILRIAKSMKAI
ncbi:hypothetical protein MKY66_05020 [Paenibacillus sp. FSL R5-0766]|uniref:hypothetical protein n=1 Tax=unclassified Paenibacillus TaxID=185978 RepID=UPI00096EA849|nr:hypothetical protein [Paenibacillus sp. FSL R5-0765]OMF63541.1 hypothetical protein BK141_17515 [Paenibacillus sp. FSL R5-0765]